MIALWVALGGAFGAVARFVVDAEVKGRWPGARSFPWATVAINVTGSLLLGLVAAAVVVRSGAPEWLAIVGVGFCGGYTTFSTASVETVRLLQEGRYRAAAVNTLVTSLASLLACGVGFALVAGI